MITLGLDDWRPRAEERSVTLSDFPALNQFLSVPSSAGVVINEHTLLNLSAYFNGVEIISGQIGITPLLVYRRLEDDERERATTHPAYKVLHDQPNPYTTPAVFWQTLVAHVLTWGNGYAEIEKDRAMRPIALWNITPDKIRPETEPTPIGTRVFYVYNGQTPLEAEDIIHVPGLGFDGIRGYTPATMARRSLGVSVAAEQYGASFFGNGAWHGVALQHPGRLKPESRERLVKSWDQFSQGSERAHRTVVLEEGMKAEKLTIPPDDAQFLGTREFGVEEIARWLNIPPYKLKHKTGERPGGNDETARIEFLTDTLDPWFVRIAQEVSRKLFPASQRATFYAEHLPEARLRLDAKTKLEIQRGYFDMGVLTAEQIAKQQNLPAPKPKPEPKSAPAPAADPEPAPDDERMRSAHRALLMDAAVRFMKVEAKRAIQASRKGPLEFQRLLRERAVEDRDTLRSALLPALRVIVAHRGVGDAEGMALSLAQQHVDASHEALLALPVNKIAEHVERLVAGWDRERALDLAERVLSGGVQ